MIYFVLINKLKMVVVAFNHSQGLHLKSELLLSFANTITDAYTIWHLLIIHTYLNIFWDFLFIKILDLLLTWHKNKKVNSMFKKISQLVVLLDCVYHLNQVKNTHLYQVWIMFEFLAQADFTEHRPKDEKRL